MGAGVSAAGVVVAGWIGTSVAVGTIIAGAVIGAAIGAVVGGIAAAVTGGSVGKGMLFGAIGGAVSGGLGAALSGPGAGAAGGVGAEAGSTVAVGTGANSAGMVAGAEGTMWGGMATSTTVSDLGAGLTTTTTTATSSMLQQIGTSVLSEGAKAGLAAYLQKDPAQDWRTTKEGAMYLSEQELEKQRIASAASHGGGGGGAGHDPANMASVQLNREKWQEEVDTRKQLQAARSENFSGLNTQRGVKDGDLVTDKGVWETKQERQQAQALGEGGVVASQQEASASQQTATPAMQAPESTTNVSSSTDRESTEEAKAAMAL